MCSCPGIVRVRVNPDEQVEPTLAQNVRGARFAMAGPGAADEVEEVVEATVVNVDRHRARLAESIARKPIIPHAAEDIAVVLGACVDPQPLAA